MTAVIVAALLALVVLIGFGSARAQADPRPDLYLLPQEALYPEGIAAENKSGTFYVSSVADGSIYRGNVRNEQAELFLPGGEDGRTQAAGLALDDGLLYVAGGQTGTVFVYDTSSGDLVRSFAAQGTGFLNDVTVNPQSGDAYITDSFVPILWRVPAEEVTGSPQTGDLEPWLDLTGTPIAYDGGFQPQRHSGHSQRSLSAHHSVQHRQPLPNRHPNQAGDSGRSGRIDANRRRRAGA